MAKKFNNEESEIMKKGTIALYGIDDNLGALSFIVELEDFELGKKQEKKLIKHAKSKKLSNSSYFIIEADEEGLPTHLLATFYYNKDNKEDTFLDSVEHSEMMYIRNITGYEVWRTEDDKNI